VKLVSFANGVQQGEISCSAANGAVTATAPPTFNTALPVKVFTHGFSPMPGFSHPLKTEFAVRWNTAYKGQVNVVLVDWYRLSTFFQVGLKRKLLFSFSRKVKKSEN
jgi:hypothetical protein